MAEYLKHRIALFDTLFERQTQLLKEKESSPIAVTLPNGSTLEAHSWVTSPMHIAKQISKSLSERIVIAKVLYLTQVDGVLWDLERPLEHDCTLQLIDFDHDDGKKVFWHSSAHVLGEACELKYGCHLCIGPPIESGYYYEMAMDTPVTQQDYAELDALSKKAVQEKQVFQRLVMTKLELLEMFKHNKYKVHIINDKIADGTSTTVYRCGPLIDLCYGPHVPHTGRIKAMKVVKNSASYFLGNANNDSLQRIYGISFPDTKQMKEYEKFVEEAAKRDHRKIGVDQELFFFNELSPGSCFFLPRGTIIYNKLVDLIKSEYWKRGFTEVVTPNMYNTKLWEVSGHLKNYAENMFMVNVEKEQFALKPMNCPGHCLMFGHRERSYRELPMRIADFGVLHRNEASGALTGLTRVRRFQQDDAHIFCRLDQLATEMAGCLDFLQHIYGIFGFSFDLRLSTRPENYLGDLETWDRAEGLLSEALTSFGHPWDFNPGDGAFYGPKIDITISDALRRKHQCATIQLDFQLPQRFDLNYRTDDHDNPFARPIMIHRAILGSVERMIAILCENYGGKWPFWLSPRQVIVVPISHSNDDYASSVAEQMHAVGIHCEADLSDNMFKKKIRNAEISQANFILIVGQEEQDTLSVNLRNRDDLNSKSRGKIQKLDSVIAKLVELNTSLENQSQVQFDFEQLEIKK